MVHFHSMQAARNDTPYVFHWYYSSLFILVCVVFPGSLSPGALMVVIPALMGRLATGALVQVLKIG